MFDFLPLGGHIMMDGLYQFCREGFNLEFNEGRLSLEVDSKRVIFCQILVNFEDKYLLGSATVRGSFNTY